MTIGERMQALGYSFLDLEKITGIPHSALQRYSAGKTKKIPADRLWLLADALHTTPDELLAIVTGTGKPDGYGQSQTNPDSAYPPPYDIKSEALRFRIGRVFEPINPNYLKMSQLCAVMRLFNRFQENPDSLSREEKQYLLDLLEHCIIALSCMQYIIERNGEAEVKEDGGAGRAVQL